MASDQDTVDKRRMGENKMRQGRPTLKTISEITGLGVTTVSRALKNGPELSAETRARVRSVADDIGYRPNRAGVRLRTGRTYVIGLILDQDVTIAEFERRIILGASSVLFETDYHLVVTPLRRGANVMEPVRYVVETGAADGLIFTHTQPRDERVRYLLARQFPFVTHGRTDMGLAHAFYDFDNERFMVEAVERLRAKGRRRLALIPPSDSLTCAYHMFDGFLEATRESGLEGIVVEGIDLDSDPLKFRVVGRQLASGPNPPDGYICANETRSIALMAGLREAGFDVGIDGDVIAKETSELLNHITPAIDSFYEDLTFAGEELARLLLRRIAGTPVSELQTIAAPQLHQRT
ncbi:LacI family transcriptional regulator [Chelativorans alearense]|uniref:LacI family transcriptional regulator n=1 Tax=Chelativorans alearense TaxID=2681495 RepID=UPI001FEBEF41|nr:LacI family transcriptional regulator [Chelativorans alearense]